LLKLGANLNAKDNQQMTPLDWAVQNGHKDIAMFLRGCGGKVNKVKLTQE
jgi:ankyrin repeat protein